MRDLKKEIFKVRLKKFLNILLLLAIVIVDLLYSSDYSYAKFSGQYVIRKSVYPMYVSIIVLVVALLIYIIISACIQLGIENILLKKSEPLLAEAVYKKSVRIKSDKHSQMFFSTVKFYSGNFAESLELANTVLHTKNAPPENSCLQRMMLCYYFMGDYYQANNAAQRIIDSFSLRKVKTIEKGTQEIALLIQYLIDNDSKSIPKAKEISVNLIGNKYAASKVLYTFLLAGAYYNQGQYDESKKLLNEVVQKGNKTFLVDKAKELLQKI